MSTVLVAEQSASHISNGRGTADVLDRLIPSWDRVLPSKLRENALYLFVMPTSRVFAIYQGRENGSLRVRTTAGEPTREIEANAVRGIYKIGGDITIAEELNKRFG
jgi:hypothetical protein